MGLIDKGRDSITIRVFDMDCGETRITTADIRELASVVRQIIMPTPRKDIRRRDKVCYRCSKVV
jgi:hypothetical protein